MTTITINRAVVEQALEALKNAEDHLPKPYSTDASEAITALRAALAQQAEPDAYGYASRLAVAIWEKHYKDTAPHWKPLDDLVGVLTQIDNMAAGMARLAQQAAPVEPVAWAFRHSDGTYHDPSVTEHSAGMVPLYTTPPQRKPLPKHDQHCVDVPGYGLMAVRLVRSVERAHNITDPQIEDRLARHGIPMPEGDPK